ncbi:MAG: nucleotidyltransferase domain-containing protein [Clostridia bacterium]|nr:nucleotidyltransferase domain-containing protein [Clostridia bacterium]
MFDVDGYLQRLIGECRDAFLDRLLYVGLQGSYMRGEATDQSDIDVMIILDRAFAFLFAWCRSAFSRPETPAR